MAKTPQDGKFAEEFTGNPPLDWNRRADGTLVIITHDGKKVILSPEFLSVYKPTIRRAVMTDPAPEPYPKPTKPPTRAEDWQPEDVGRVSLPAKRAGRKPKSSHPKPVVIASEAKQSPGFGGS